MNHGMLGVNHGTFQVNLEIFRENNVMLSRADHRVFLGRILDCIEGVGENEKNYYTNTYKENATTL